MEIAKNIIIFSEEASDIEGCKQILKEDWLKVTYCQTKIELLKYSRSISPELILISLKSEKTNFEELFTWSQEKATTQTRIIFLGNWDVLRLETINKNKSIEAWPYIDQMRPFQLIFYLHTILFGSDAQFKLLDGPGSVTQKTTIKTAQDFIDLLARMWSDLKNQQTINEQVLRKWVMAFYAEQLKRISRREITEFEACTMINKTSVGLVMVLDKPGLYKEQLVEELKKIQFDKVFLGDSDSANFKPGLNVWLSVPFYMSGNILLKEIRPYTWQVVSFMDTTKEYTHQNVFVVSGLKAAPSVSPDSESSARLSSRPSETENIFTAVSDFEPSHSPSEPEVDHYSTAGDLLAFTNQEEPNTDGVHGAVLNEVITLKEQLANYELELSRLREANQLMASNIKRLMEERKQPTTDEELKAIKISLEEKLKKAMGMVTDFGQQIKRSVVEQKKLQEERDGLASQIKLLKQRVPIPAGQPVTIKK